MVQINFIYYYWEKLGKVILPKYVDQRRPTILSNKVIDNLLFFFS